MSDMLPPLEETVKVTASVPRDWWSFLIGGTLLGIPWGVQGVLVGALSAAALCAVLPPKRVPRGSR